MAGREWDDPLSRLICFYTNEGSKWINGGKLLVASHGSELRSTRVIGLLVFFVIPGHPLFGIFFNLIRVGFQPF